MNFRLPSAACLALLASCDSPATQDPQAFAPSAVVRDAPLPMLQPLSALELPPGAGPDAIEALNLRTQETLIRAEALRARTRLASGEVLTPEERARLNEAAARWTGP